MAPVIDEQPVIDALRAAGARFAFVHGSRADDTRVRPDSDLDAFAAAVTRCLRDADTGA